MLPVGSATGAPWTGPTDRASWEVEDMEKLVDGLVELAVRLTVLGAGVWVFREWVTQMLAR